VDGEGIPLGVFATPANRHDSLFTRKPLKDRGLIGVVSEKVKLAPLQANKRWVERTNRWQDAHKKVF